MPYTFNLMNVSGKAFSWTIEDRDIALDQHNHVLAFTKRFPDGSTQSFALSNDGNFARKLLSSPFDEAGGAAVGASLGRRYGIVGVAVGALAGYIAAEIAEAVILSNADYYDETGKLCFHGIIKAQR